MDWLDGESSGLVETAGQPSLFLSSYGPKRRTPKTPVVIVIHGLGGTYLEWIPTMKLLSRFTRAYLFERAGYHPSEKSSQTRTPSNIVAEMKAMLLSQGIHPPYILVGHSYGGILVRQALADFNPEDVAGAVLVDSTPDMPPNWPEDWATLLGDASYESVVGLEANHCFATDDDFQTVIRTGAGNEGPGSVSEEEFENRRSQELIAQLRGRQVMGSKPLSVIMCDMVFDFTKIHEHGVKHGNGTPEAREALRKLLETLSQWDEDVMRGHLDLSSNGRFVKATGKARTHNCQIVEPSFVVQEIEWVYRQCEDVEAS